MLRLGETLPNIGDWQQRFEGNTLAEVASPISNRRSLLFPERANRTRYVYIPSYVGGLAITASLDESENKEISRAVQMASELGNIAEFFIWADQIQWQSEIQRITSFFNKINLPTYCKGLYSSGLQDRCRFMI